MQDIGVRSCSFPRRSWGGTRYEVTKRRATRESATHSTGRRHLGFRAHGLTVWTVSMVFLALSPGMISPTELRAQTTASKATAATASEPGETVPLARYVPKDHIFAYIEFEGLDAHSASWQNTAAYKMLADTPLGAMLEIMSGQLVDKALTFLPNKRLSGPEIVTLVKRAAKSGWVFALHHGKGPDTRATFVMRGAVTKELKPLSSRLLGWLMGAQKYKAETKEGRTMVVVPYAVTTSTTGAAINSGWVWWPEKTDLVISSAYPAGADTIIAALDSKAASAGDHPVVRELKKPEGSFDPVCVAFMDTTRSANTPGKLTELAGLLHDGQGVNQIDLRWGFDGTALMTVTRLVAPKPWKSLLAVFDQPTFEKTSLLPMPDSVESFVDLSISPSKLVEALEDLGGPAGSEIKAQIDQLSESIKTAGSIDLKKDILGHLGPRMVAYLGSGRSATTNDDSLEAAFKNGFSTTAAVTAIQSFFPKLTLVAEVSNPEAFGKGLDTAMIAINNELKAQAIEKQAEEHAATEKGAPGGTARPKGARSEPGGDRTKRRRPKEPSFPHFQTTISQAKTQNSGSQVKSFVLITPSDSALRFGPSSFRPTILLEDKYVAFAVSSDAARAAVAAAKRKDWKPSSDLERSCEKVPSNMVMLSVNDVKESLSSLLASLPGTLQTMINTSIALAKARAGGATPPVAGASQPPPSPGMGAGGGGGGAAMRLRGGRLGAPAAPGPGAARPGFGEQPTPGSTGSAGSTNDSMIVLKVEPDQLPKAADLKAQIFPTTWSISLAEGEIRFVSRGAFPDLSALLGTMPVASMMPAAQSLLTWAQQSRTESAATTGGAGSTANTPAAAGSPAIPKNAQPGGGPSRAGKRRG